MSILKSCKYIILVAVLVLKSGDLALKAQPGDHGEIYPLLYAKNFEIIDFSTHRIATVNIGKGDSSRLYRFALVPKGKHLPELPKDIPIIRTPVKRVAVLETIHIGFLEAINQLDKVIAAATDEHITNPIIRKRIDAGIIQKIQTNQTINIERLLLLGPDLIFTSTPSEQTPNIPAQLSRAGLPVVITAEYRERHPLARAEWIKFIAAFFNDMDEASKTFDMIAARYEALLEKVERIKTRPDVFCGAPYSGIWHMAGGNSYMAQLIEDAKGNYLWNNTNSSNAIFLDVERVFLKAANADIWLNPSFYRTSKALFAADPRFRKFRAAQTGNIYNHTRQQTDGKGNPIWESGIVHPDDILADLIKIFHPDQMSDREFVYYEKLR
jgi:iron complex transport system substrate-binding protein